MRWIASSLVIALAACSGGAFTALSRTVVPEVGRESGLTPLSAMRALAIARPGWVAPTVKPHHGKSWAKPVGRSEILLYAGNADGVGFYDYNTGKQVGEIASVSSPEGICVDKKGDVYIAQADENQVVEFTHGGIKGINTYVDSNVIGCSVDASGDVSVTAWNTGAGYGNVCIWKGGKAKKSPTCIDGRSSTNCYNLWTGGYDDTGNLIVEGEYSGTGGGMGVCALMNGGSTLEEVRLKGATISFGNPVMWDGKYVALSDQEAGGMHQTAVYQSILSTSKNGPTLMVVHTVQLDDTCFSNYSDVLEPFVVGKENTPVDRSEGKVVVGVNQWCFDGSSGPSVEFWHYPAGGDSFRRISSAGSEGVAVSIGT